MQCIKLLNCQGLFLQTLFSTQPLHAPEPTHQTPIDWLPNASCSLQADPRLDNAAVSQQIGLHTGRVEELLAAAACRYQWGAMVGHVGLNGNVSCLPLHITTALHLTRIQTKPHANTRHPHTHTHRTHTRHTLHTYTAHTNTYTTHTLTHKTNNIYKSASLF